jgi:hypothetical protein
MQEDDWGNPRLIDIFPAIRMPLLLALAAFSGRGWFHGWQDWFGVLWTILCYSIFPIFVVSMVSFVYWTTIIRRRERLIDVV